MSELTQRQLQEISKHLEEHLSLISEAEMERDQQTYCTFRPSELHSTKEAIDELLALRSRDAGDEEVENLESRCFDGADHTSVSSEAVHDLANLAIARGQTRTDAVNKAVEWAKECEGLQEQLREAREEIERINKVCDIFEKNSKAAADLCDENWKLKAEIERLTGCLKKANDGFEEHERLWYLEQNKTEALTAELAALKAAPGMEEVDALGKSATQTLAQIVLDRPETNRPAIDTVPAGRYAKLRDLIDAMLATCRRSIAAREEVVGLLKHILSCIITVKQKSKCSHEVAMLAGNEAIDSAGEVYLLKQELAALKSAPGMTEVDAMERELLDEIPSWSQRTSIELLANLARRSNAAREEVVGMLKHILSCIITVKQKSKCSHEVAMLAGNEAIDSAGEVYLLKQELAALKSAPGMTDLNGLESAWRDSGNPVAYVEMIIDIARRSIAAREEVVGLLDHILSCIITVKQENTPEWMEYIAEEVNRINEAMGDPDRVSLRFGGIVIVKGGPEIVEGK